MSDRGQMQEAAVDDFLEKLRYMGCERPMAAILNKRLSSMHNTDQQTFWRVIQMVVVEYSKLEYSDGRNEHSVQFTKAIADLQIPLPFI